MSTDPSEKFVHAEYWDQRYLERDEGQFEWAKSFANVRPFFEAHLPPATSTPKIVQLGCGNSTLSKDLFDLSYHSQTNVDFSEVVISTMRSKHPEMEWQVMDVRKMTFSSETFDVAIDKATLDAMLYGSLWDPDEEVRNNVKAYVDEVARILTPGGRWLYITWRQPHFLRPLLQRPDVWSLDVHTLQDEGGSFEYFGYVMTKRS
ncbi:S-adenosyl-L-methionine-dependent methyltransferase [Aulographum hederae CBS 113979]|uniref:S-adenosyl-L-methionine-dependent methyltransferase n=1 Tax=Aulographum hederae CBS 113979 TaxID=1176131 RepID=A0A6G1H0H8_9PEZI|nr:S-adenosyl-L-methionine-dependent methyltransferase [Aulographum hederae CBS 113979]